MILSRQHFGFAYWENKDSEVIYHHNKIHTLSLYLSGGYRTTRIDCNVGYGHKGAVCLLPQDSDSSWIVDGRIKLFHFYFSDKAVRRYLVKTHDVEPSVIEIPELIFSDHRLLKLATYQLFKTMGVDSYLNKEIAITEFFETLLSNSLISKNKNNYTGGLSPSVNKKLKDYIHDHMSKNITLKELSSFAGLSEFHLQKMFKHTNGISPHDYLVELRLERAKDLLGKMTLSQISLDCGFSHQSHFHRVFKSQIGITPLQYLDENRGVRH